MSSVQPLDVGALMIKAALRDEFPLIKTNEAFCSAFSGPPVQLKTGSLSVFWDEPLFSPMYIIREKDPLPHSFCANQHCFHPGCTCLQLALYDHSMSHGFATCPYFPNGEVTQARIDVALSVLKRTILALGIKEAEWKSVVMQYAKEPGGIPAGDLVFTAVRQHRCINLGGLRINTPYFSFSLCSTTDCEAQGTVSISSVLFCPRHARKRSSRHDRIPYQRLLIPSLFVIFGRLMRGRDGCPEQLNVADHGQWIRFLQNLAAAGIDLTSAHLRQHTVGNGVVELRIDLTGLAALDFHLTVPLGNTLYRTRHLCLFPHCYKEVAGKASIAANSTEPLHQSYCSAHQAIPNKYSLATLTK